MIDSVEELESILDTIEKNQELHEKFSAEYDSLSWWHPIRKHTLLTWCIDLSADNAALFGRLNEGLSPLMQLKVDMQTTMTYKGKKYVPEDE